MWNLQDDKELDRISREAAENYSMDQSPDSWNKVHFHLDAEMPEERRRRYLLFFLLFLFIGSGVFWLTRMNADDINDQVITAKNVYSDNQSGSKKSNDDAVTSTPTSQSKLNTQPVPNQESNVQPEKKGTDAGLTPSSITPSQKSIQVTSRSSSNKRGNKVGAKNKQANRKEVSKHDGVAEQRQDMVDANVPLEEDPSPKKDAVAPPVADNQQQTDPQAASPVDEARKQDPAPASKDKIAKTRVNSRWTIGAAYAPDISTVKFEYTQPLGLNLGLMVEYQLSNKFSLQTGLIYTKKNYKMNGEDYHPPKGTWLDYVKLEDVTGNCIMLDIPINARFNAVRKKSSNIFFTAGLSTYLMKEENYTFFYHYNGVPTSRERTYETDSEYPFSILNISAGYEKKLSKAFSLQVEPFFKQTLTGVGFGEISLNSTGVYFSLRYNPLKAVKQAATAKQ